MYTLWWTAYALFMIGVLTRCVFAGKKTLEFSERILAIIVIVSYGGMVVGSLLMPLIFGFAFITGLPPEPPHDLKITASITLFCGGAVAMVIGLCKIFDEKTSLNDSGSTIFLGAIIAALGAYNLHNGVSETTTYRAIAERQQNGTFLLTVRTSTNKGATETPVELTEHGARECAQEFLQQHSDEFEPVGILLKLRTKP